MPNPNTISWIHYQDVQIDDASVRQQFISLMQTGNYSQALTLLSTYSDQLNAKAYMAHTINTIVTGVMDLETRFHTNVIIYLSNLATTFQTWVDNFKNRQTWNNTIEYYKNNFVIYNNDLYMAIQDVPVGYMPTNTTYWLHLGLMGIDGAPGTDVVMKYDWNNSVNYEANDLVVYNGQIYVALSPNIGIQPDTAPTTWLLFMRVEPGIINVGTLPPEDPINNTIWFQTDVDPLTQTSTDGLVGIFKRYIETQDIWEEMYPETVFTLIVDKEEFVPLFTVKVIDIATTDWINNQWSYTSSFIGATSSVYVYPVMPISDEQYGVYNYMTMTITGNTVTLTAESTPTVDIPIRLQIV